MYLAKRTPPDVAKSPSPQRHKLYVYGLSVFGRQKALDIFFLLIYLFLFVYMFTCLFKSI